MLDLTAITKLPAQGSLTTAANEWATVAFGAQVGRISIRPITNDAKLTLDVVDDEATVASEEYSTLSADVWFSFDIKEALDTGLTTISQVAITSASAGTRIEFLVEAR